MRQSTLSVIGMTLFASTGAHAAIGLNATSFPGQPVADTELAAIRGSGLPSWSRKLVDGGVRQELSHIRGSNFEQMDNWWSDRDLSSMQMMRL